MTREREGQAEDADRRRTGSEERDVGGGAERDPGDAVPPGVAPSEPPEPSEEDRRVLEKLRDLPRRR